MAPKEDATPIDKDAIAAMVRDMVKENGVGFIPDALEEKLYTNVITLAMRCVDKMVSETRIEFMGHELVMDIRKSRSDGHAPRPKSG